MCHNQGHLWYLHTTGSNVAVLAKANNYGNKSRLLLLPLCFVAHLEKWLVSRWHRGLLELGICKGWPVFEKVRGMRSMTDLIIMMGISCYSASSTDI